MVATTKSKGGAKLGENKPTLELAVEYGGSSTQKNSRSLGVRFKYDSTAERNKIIGGLTNSRCQVLLTVDAQAEDDTPGQQKIADGTGASITTEAELTVVADVHRLSVGSADITAKLSINRDQVQDGRLDPFCYRSGWATFVRLGEAGEGEDASVTTEGGDDDD